MRLVRFFLFFSFLVFGKGFFFGYCKMFDRENGCCDCVADLRWVGEGGKGVLVRALGSI